MPRKKLDMNTINRKTIKRFTKKELVALTKQFDFGLKDKVLTKDLKSVIVNRLMNGTNFDIVRKLIKVKPKRKQTQKQIDAFQRARLAPKKSGLKGDGVLLQKKSKVTDEDKLIALKEFKEPVTEESKQLIALRQEVVELKLLLEQKNTDSVQDEPTLQAKLLSGDVSSIAELSETLNLDDERSILQLIESTKLELQTETTSVSIGLEQSQLRSDLNKSGLRGKDIRFLLSQFNLSTVIATKQEGVVRLAAGAQSNPALLNELNHLVEDPEAVEQLIEEVDNIQGVPKGTQPVEKAPAV